MLASLADAMPVDISVARRSWTLTSMRALCSLVADARDPAAAGSMSFSLAKRNGAALELLQDAELAAHERGLRHRLHIDVPRATLHVWRAREN